MPDFRYQDGEFYCESVPLRKIAEAVGTPCYVYSHATLVRQFRSFDSAFSEVPHLIAYAIKANSNLALLRLLTNEGAGADIVSGGELYRALQAGIEPQRIVFAGVGKSDAGVRYALRSNILMFNVESSDELRAIDRVAGEMHTKARVALRINPDIDPKTHPYIATGLKKSKFGISAERALIPNLLFLRPVAIYGWVLGSMSGLIRRATRALVCISPATRSMARSSSDDSTLNIKMFDRRA